MIGRLTRDAVDAINRAPLPMRRGGLDERPLAISLVLAIREAALAMQQAAAERKEE